MKRYRTFLVGFYCFVHVFFISCGPAVASQHKKNKPEGLFTGPLNASSAATLPKGAFNVEPYLVDAINYGSFDNDWNRSSGNTSHGLRSVTQIAYGFNDRFTITLLPHFGYNVQENVSDSTGLRVGDTTARLHYRLNSYNKNSWIPIVSLAISEIIPTGKYDGLGDHPSNGLGTGVWKTVFGVWTQDKFWLPNDRPLRVRWNFNYTIANNDPSVHGTSIYGTGPNFNGKSNSSDSFNTDLAFEYSMTRHWVPVLEFAYTYTNGGSLEGMQSVRDSTGMLLRNEIRRSTKASESFQIAPALEFNWSRHYGLIAGATITATGRNTGETVAAQMAFNMYLGP